MVYQLGRSWVVIYFLKTLIPTASVFPKCIFQVHLSKVYFLKWTRQSYEWNCFLRPQIEFFPVFLISSCDGSVIWEVSRHGVWQRREVVVEVDESEVGNNLLANLTRFASHKPPTIPPRQNFAPYEASSIVCKYWSPSGATSMGYNFVHQVLLCSNHMHMHMHMSAV